VEVAPAPAEVLAMNVCTPDAGVFDVVHVSSVDETTVSGAQRRPVTPVGDTMVTLVVVDKFIPVRVMTTPVLAGPDDGDTLLMIACVVVKTSSPLAGPAMSLIATTNIIVPFCPETPATMHVTDVDDTHVAEVHVFSTPVAPYVIVGKDVVRPNPVPVRVTVVVRLPSNVDGDTDVTVANGAVPLMMRGTVDDVETPAAADVSTRT
jgi:hypothetical protein